MNRLFKTAVLAMTVFVGLSLASETKSSYARYKDSHERYVYEGIPDSSTTWDADTTLDSIPTTGGLWVKLGPCPSSVADSGQIGVVVGGTSGAVGCSLFVTMHPKKWSANPTYLKHIASSLTNNTGTIITDSLTNETVGTYQIPALRGQMGYNFLAKLYMYSGGAKTALKRIFLIRDDK